MRLGSRAIRVVGSGRAVGGQLAGSRLAVGLVGLRIATLGLAIRLVGLALVLAGLRLAVRLVGLAGSLKRRARLLSRGILKLAHPLAYASKQLGNALGTKKQHEHEDDEDNGLRIAEKQKREDNHGAGRREGLGG